MARQKKKTDLSPEMRTALITAGVAIITALFASPVLVEVIRRDPTPTPNLNASTLSIYNEHCLDQDFFVDDLLVSTVKSGAQVDIQVSSGEHHYYACEYGTSNCGSIYDLYLDGAYYSSIYEGETQYVSLEPGAHSIQNCISGTEICSVDEQEWAQDSLWKVSRDPTCP